MIRSRRLRLPLREAKRVSILEVARRLGLGEPVCLGREWVVLCPLHDDHAPSCHLDPKKNWWYCFVCQEGGDGIRLVKRARGLDFATAVRWLAPGGSHRRG